MPSKPLQHRAAGWRPTAIVRREQKQAFDRMRGREQPWRSLYKDPRWLAGRLEHLAEHPLCLRCEAGGRVTAATVVNHRRRHRGDLVLFFDRGNWESACKACHDGAIQREERAEEAARDRL